MPAPSNTTRENLYYIGWGKQGSGFGTSTAPTNFWRWLDGTDANPERKVSKEREGDTSPHINLVYVNEQHWQIKVKEYIRPQTLGCALQALLGTGSDSYVAPTKNTTLAASIVAGASTFQSTADLGNSSTLAMNFDPAFSNSAYEVQTVNLASRTGAGPYTYTLAASATFKNAHTNGATITSASTHTFTRQQTTYDAYSIEAAYNQSGFGKAIRIQDCVCYQLKVTMETGKLVVFEHDWYGSLAAVQAALQSITSSSFEGSSVVGNSGSPFHYNMGGSSWSVDSSSSNLAAQLKKVEITMKNSTGAEEFQTEGLSPTYFIPGNFDIELAMEGVFTNYQQYAETYYNVTSLATNSTDSYIQGYGQFSVTLTQDAVNSLVFSLPNVAYTAAKLNPPKLDAKALMQAITATAQKTQAQPTPLTITLSNSQASAY